MVIGCTTVVMGVVLLSDARRVLSKIFHLSSLISALLAVPNHYWLFMVALRLFANSSRIVMEASMTH